MAFGKEMAMMGKSKLKPEKKAPDEQKGKEKPVDHSGKVGGEAGDGPGDAKSPIHSHLQSMHEQTGNAHSHVEHHMGGGHTSHHISEHGEISGPNEHGSTDEVKQSMDQVLGQGDGMAPASGNAQVGNDPVHSMSGF
jgi:hypothetical protein